MQRQAASPAPKVVSLWRGLYVRVADKVGGEVFYFNGMARPKRESAKVVPELNPEFRKVLTRMGYKLR